MPTRSRRKTHHTSVLPPSADWLTVGQVQDYLNLSQSCAYRLIKSGVIPHRRFGRVIRVPRQAITPAIKIPKLAVGR